MNTLLILEAVAFVVLLMLSAFFSSSETAMFSLDAQEVNRLGESHAKKAGILQDLLSQPTRLLSTILIGNTVVNVVLWIIGALLLESAGVLHEGLQVGILTALTVLFGELAPKRLALLNYRRLALAYALPLRVLVRLLRLPRSFLEGLTGTFSHFFLPSGHILSRAEYDTLMEASGETGGLDEHEHKMMHTILSLERLSAGDVMTPRVDLEGVDLSEDVDLFAAAKKARTRYLVLYREQLDDIVGLLDVRTYLFDPGRNWKKAVEVPLYIPELCPLDKLLTQMLAARRRAAIIVDEYGGTSGLVSRGDILDELTGEMDPEDSDKLVCEELTDHAWLLDAQLSLHDVNRVTGLNLHSDTADRLSGWFLEQAEHVPSLNEIVTGPGYKAMVRQMRRNRILMILIERQPLADEEALS